MLQSSICLTVQCLDLLMLLRLCFSYSNVQCWNGNFFFGHLEKNISTVKFRVRRTLFKKYIARELDKRKNYSFLHYSINISKINTAITYRGFSNCKITESWIYEEEKTDALIHYWSWGMDIRVTDRIWC